MKKTLVVAGLICFLYRALAIAEEAQEPGTDIIRRQIVNLNQNYADLIRMMKRVDERIKNSGNTTLNISLVKANDVKLASIEIYDNNQLIATHLYSPVENEALKLGGRQLLYKAELKTGNHNLVISCILTKEGEPQKKTVTTPLSVVMGKDYFIELQIEEDKADIILNYSQLIFDNPKQ